jgi:hypothetical protein
MGRMMAGQEAPGKAWRQWKVESAWQEYDYVLAVFPEGEGGEQVKRLACELQSIPDKAATWPETPSIRVARFRAREEMEETLIRWIQRVCHMQQRFRVEVEGPISDSDGGAFLRVRDHGPFKKLANGLAMVDQYIQSCGEPPVEWTGVVHCRLTDMTGKENRRSWQPGEHERHFQANFLVHSLVLMKEGPGSSRPELVNVFPLFP